MSTQLSDRILALINIYTAKVTSMEETPQNCIHYNFIISELYTKMNYMKRLEVQERTSVSDYVQTISFIELLEIETNKILQEELLIKQLQESQEKAIADEKARLELLNQELENTERNKEENISQIKTEKMLIGTSKNSFIEVDASFSDIIKGGKFLDEDK